MSAGKLDHRSQDLVRVAARRHGLEPGAVRRQQGDPRGRRAERSDRGVDERAAHVGNGDRVREPAGERVQVRETRGLGFGGLTSAAFGRVGDVPVVSRFPVAVGDRARDPGGDDPQHDRDPATELPVGDEHDEPDAAGQRDEHPRERAGQHAGDDREQEPETARNTSVGARGRPGERRHDGHLHRPSQQEGRRERHGPPTGPAGGSHGRPTVRGAFPWGRARRSRTQVLREAARLDLPGVSVRRSAGAGEGYGPVGRTAET